MPIKAVESVKSLALGTRTALRRPIVLVLLPSVMLASFWLGGHSVLITMALILPILFATDALIGHAPRRHDGPLTPKALEAALDDALSRHETSGRACAALAVALDHPEDVARDLDSAGQEAVAAAIADRIRGVLREGDRIARTGSGRFALALPDLRRADHETLVGITRRIRDAVAEPVSLGGRRIFVTVSQGFCLPGELTPVSGARLLAAADSALAAARAAGGNTVRGYDADLPDAAPMDADLAATLASALDDGQIIPWFQPQIAADGSRLDGVEALARWDHPTRGLVQPSDFLPGLHAAGLSRRLGEVMLYASLRALRDWDRAGLKIPCLSINLSREELADPDLSDRVRWELDRFDIAPERLTVELLETALAGDTDAVERNLRALAGLGCRIDLDDFGTGTTSITAIRRFAVTRLKIDRTFVSRVDHDSTQANMVDALVTMARGLGIRTLAEGVETLPELAKVAELGCDTVQGFAVARPMPAEDFPGWLAGWRNRQGRPAPRRGVTELSSRAQQGKTA